MDVMQAVLLAVTVLFLAVALLRIFRTPLKLAVRLLSNTALGFLALWAVNLMAGFTGVTLGINLLNALVIAVLGLPGFVLLLLTQWVL